MARWATCLILPVALSLTFAAFVFGVHRQQDGETATLDEENFRDPEGDDLWGGNPGDLSETTVKPFSLKVDTPQINKTKKSSILLVSTLDGTLSALDVNRNGDTLWKLETSPGTMLSSSISKVEMRSRGRWVRLIPSLDGSLYKFDGDSIDPLPVSADSLLHSSYQVSDDLLITGGKEVDTYGIDAITGRLQYSCSRDGCHTEPPAASSSSNPFLVIRRHTKTVRAIEPRTGLERWNFSVGHHEAALLHTGGDAFADCHTQEDSKEQMECFLREEGNAGNGEVIPVANVIDPTIQFKVDIPDGSILALHPQGNMLWKRKFDSPVTNVWQLENNRLIPVNLFSMDSIPTFEETNGLAPPLLYVGIHKQQVYIQESAKMAELVSNSHLNLQGNTETSMSVYRLAWNPLPITSLSQQGRPGRYTVSDNEEDEPGNGSTPLPVLDEDPKVTALIVRHESEYPFDRGFYILDASQGNQSLAITPTPHSDSESTTDDEEATVDEETWKEGDDVTIEKVFIYYVAPLWVWWREVILISLITAIFFHVMITRQVIHLLRERFVAEMQHHIRSMVPVVSRLAIMEQRNSLPTADSSAVDAVAVPESKIDMIPAEISRSQSQPSSASTTSITSLTPYVSRYLTDFEPLQCLGRGGFGLVFEARNLLDDCHYAVKRIQLPNSQEAREKVMREVKALAKLDNPHIVRYFHAWIECPPPGWQENEDAKWLDLESMTGPTLPTHTTTGHTESVSRRADSYSVEDEISCFGRIRGRSLRRQSTSDDSSFGVVFEDSNPLKSSPESRNGESSGKARKSLFQAPNASAISLDESSSFEESDDSDDGDSIQFVAGTSPVEMKKSDRAPEAKMFLFIQMQLCRKESLREWLRTHVSHRDPYQVLHMFNEIIRAVEYVHLQGLIHRDLKPSNIFFAPDGAIKIGDFGLVTAMTEETGYYVTSPCHESDPSGAVNGNVLLHTRKHTDQVGTQLYMSPEQIEGKPYNHKVDIYSLGLIFLELLWPLNTQMEQVTVLSQLKKSKFPPGFCDKYPEEEILLRKMLSRDPDSRPTTFGIRASPPLISHQDPSIYDIPQYLHYNLQRPRSTSFRTSSTSSNS